MATYNVTYNCIDCSSDQKCISKKCIQRLGPGSAVNTTCDTANICKEAVPQLAKTQYLYSCSAAGSRVCEFHCCNHTSLKLGSLSDTTICGDRRACRYLETFTTNNRALWSTGTIVGISIGVVLLVLLGSLVCYLHKRRKLNEEGATNPYQARENDRMAFMAKQAVRKTTMVEPYMVAPQSANRL